MAEKKNCPEGKTWDNLLRTCIKMGPIPTRKLHPPTEPVLTVVDPLLTKVSPAKSTGPPTVLLLGQTLWICVILVTLGAILALTIWFVMFRRQSKARKNDGVAEDSVQEVLKKTEPAVEFHAPQLEENGQDLQGVSDGSCRPMHQPNPKCEDGFGVCRDDHRVPLPATELGGTALVTAKTV
ncbi:tumor necrosis factor receptor superfamily member 13C-like [Poecilia latipinna]|uniref:tumor necrosis factor receptor superfamily member 13C-like n=1 Tax=Poecilia latipinna TaxID=48699 RepID=UPI00072DCB21|nr:PREDICTED: tumor necrosis factor receptor superfamily member 13C-like [Poecilia latipinna]